MKLCVLALIIIVACNQYIHAIRNDEQNKSNLSNIQGYHVNSTKNRYKCETVRDDVKLVTVLIFFFALGSLMTGTIAGVIILQVKLTEVRERQRSEDIIMNIIEWNDLRKKAMHKMRENEVTGNGSNDCTPVGNRTPEETIVGDHIYEQIEI